jgi:citrate lyase subunit beta/citryl-CoA lyase
MARAFIGTTPDAGFHGFSEVLCDMRSLLFVPADSEKKLAKGFDAGADALILDLEDAVGLDRKPVAREIGCAFLKDARPRQARPALIVRVNAIETGLIDADLAGIMPGSPDAVLLPKALGGQAVAHLDAKLNAHEAMNGLPAGSTKILVLATETAASLFLAGSYKGSSARLTGIAWGAEDLSADIGAETNRDAAYRFTEPFRFARSICLMAAAAAEVMAIDTVYPNFRDEAGFRAECEEGRRDGFSTKLAIHPAQVPIINEVFTPSAAVIAESGKIVAAFAAAPGAGVVNIGGQMFDVPHLRRAERILARVRTG